MPVVRSIMSNLKKQYGDKKGESVYYAMENSGKIPHNKKKLRSERK